jgi:hypothetical protein
LHQHNASEKRERDAADGYLLDLFNRQDANSAKVFKTNDYLSPGDSGVPAVQNMMRSVLFQV